MARCAVRTLLPKPPAVAAAGTSGTLSGAHSAGARASARARAARSRRRVRTNSVALGVRSREQPRLAVETKRKALVAGKGLRLDGFRRWHPGSRTPTRRGKSKRSAQLQEIKRREKNPQRAPARGRDNQTSRVDAGRPPLRNRCAHAEQSYHTRTRREFESRLRRAATLAR